MSTPIDLPRVPDFDQLVVELAQVVAVGASASALERVEPDVRGLMAFACVQQASSPNTHDRSRRLVDVLSRVTQRLPEEGGLRRGLAILLGTERGYRLVKSTDRRVQAAQLLYDTGMSGATFLRRHQSEALTVVAEELLRFEDEFRLRATRQVVESDGPVFTALAVQWLDHFSYYYRSWTPLSGLRNDIRMYLKRRKRTPTHRALASYASSSLWHYACFIHSVGRFLDERGGIWMFSDQTVEQAIADSVYLVGWHTTFSEREDSWLVLALILQQSSPTLVLFEHELASTAEGKAALSKWTDWLHSCTCDLRHPSDACTVHQVVRHAERFCTLVDGEWSRIASWYRHPPARLATSSADSPG